MRLRGGCKFDRLLGESDLYGRHKDRAFLPVDELPEADAIQLIETYQPNRALSSDSEREAARAIVNLLGRFTLAVESAAVYLGQFSEDVTCAGFLDRLKKEGLDGLTTAALGSTPAEKLWDSMAWAISSNRPCGQSWLFSHSTAWQAETRFLPDHICRLSSFW